MTAPNDSLAIAGIGAQVRLRLAGSRQAELAEALRAAWSCCLAPSPTSAEPDGPADVPEVSVALLAERDPASLIGYPMTVSASDLPWVLTQTTQTVTRALIQAQTGRLLMLHAGAVSHPVSGRSLVFVAPGGTGKTTLAGVLGRRYGYLSDETVAIDDDDRILPYPKPLSMVRPGGGPKLERSPAALGLLPAPAAPVVGRVLLLERDDSHRGEPEVQELGLLDGIELLTPQTSALYALPRGLHRLARLRETTGPVLRVRYAEATSLVGLTAQLIGEAP